MAMNENRKREWVKNAIIIFLVIMLLLTFFSNTIMNYSLPEVSAQYLNSGNLSEQIRGSGTVEANQSYEVKIDETRKIASVEVKAGDAVTKDQVLFKLEDSESEELVTAEKELRAAKKSYEEAMLSTGFDYRSDQLDIENQEEALQLLKDELSKISGYQKAYDAAKDKVRSVESDIRDIESDIKQYEKDKKQYDDVLSAVSAEDYSSLSAADYQKIQSAKTTLENAEKNKAKTEERIKDYESEISSGGNASAITAKRKEIENKQLEMDKTQESINKLLYGDSDSGDGGSGDASDNKDNGSSQQSLSDLQATLKQQELDMKYLREEYNNLLSDSSSYSSNQQKLNAEKTTLGMNEKRVDSAKKSLETIISDIKNGAKKNSAAVQDKIDSANEKLADVKNKLEDAQAEEAEAKEKASVTEEAQETKIREAETALEKAKIALSQKQETDAVQAGKDALALQELKTSMDEAAEKVEKLKAESVGAEIKAPVGGKITSLNVTAGEQAAKDAVVAVIEMSEKGYTLEITATVEQSKKVKVGDEAEIQYFWYGDAKAVLQSINPDKENPAKNRILKFAVTGDVTPGQQLQIAMGSKGQNYQYIVPNSAIREDNNGKFVLSVVAKSSPLGNRYVAERVNIEVLASDDTSSAVSGDIVGGEFIISTSTKPIEAGMQVRLVEN